MRAGLILAFLFLPACSSFTVKDSLTSAALSAAAGGIGGLYLSPNPESRMLNGAVFGALGGIAGYFGSKLLWGVNSTSEKAQTLEEREIIEGGREDIRLPSTNEALPAFIEQRLTPLVLERWTERDTVAPDGSLSEPHQVWRIKRLPELVPGNK